MAHQHNWDIQWHSHWKIQDRRQNTQTKYNPEKANNTKHSKTKLPWFSRLLRHSDRKRDGCCSRPTQGKCGVGPINTSLREG